MATSTPATGRRRPYAPRVSEDVRRTQLLDAALRLVVSRGHGAATMAAIADEAGVTKPVVYSMYANRGALLGALLKREQELAMAQLLSILPPGAGKGGLIDWGQTFADIFIGFLEAVRDAPDRWRCVLLDVSGMPEEFHAARAKIRGQIIKRLTGIVDKTLKRSTATEVDPEVLTHALMAVFESSAALVVKHPRKFPPARFAGTMNAVIDSLL